MRGEPDGVTVSGSDVATVEFDEVRLLDLATGAARWRTELPGLARARAVFTAHRVIVGTRTEVVLLDRATGRRVGAVPVRRRPSTSSLTQVRGSTTSSSPRTSTARSPASTSAPGLPLWSRSYGGSVVDRPAADGGLVVANWDLGTDTAMRVLSATTGEVVWDLAARRRPAPLPRSPAAACSSPPARPTREAVFVAFDATTEPPAVVRQVPGTVGPERRRRSWPATRLPRSTGSGPSPPSTSSSGQPRWQTRTHTSVLYARMVANARTVIFQTFDDHVVALDRATGKVVLGHLGGRLPDRRRRHRRHPGRGAAPGRPESHRSPPGALSPFAE